MAAGDCGCLDVRRAIHILRPTRSGREEPDESRAQRECSSKGALPRSGLIEVYGYVSAPSIGLELPIYLGGNDDNMALGAAHMTYTSLPIGGESTNCVLSGHSGYIGRIFFDYLPNLSIGDEIVVENYWDTLTYKVIDKQINKSYE